MNKRHTLRLLLWIFLIGIVFGVSALYYVFNMPRRNISNEKAVYTLDANQLISEFRKDEALATVKYRDQTISVKGEIKNIRTLDNHSIVFSLNDDMEGVSCTVDSADVVKNSIILNRFTKGSTVTFKGRCSGMLMDVQVINCVPE
jgi:hypothetical protein